MTSFGSVFPYPSANHVLDDQTTGVLVQPDLNHEFGVIGDYFVSRLGHTNAQRVGEIIQQWRPRLLVCDEMDFGAMVAAERFEVPLVIVNVIASGGLTRPDHVAEPLRALRESFGLGPDPRLSMLEGDLVVAPFPPSFRDPSFPLPQTAVSIRSETGIGSGDHPAVDWLRAGSEQTRIYFTLGTVFNTESGDLCTRVLEGLQELPARILATVGTNIDPSSIPISAANVRIERFVPQSLVLPVVDLVVNHGGSGSVIGALAHGIPLIVIPLGADQELNAHRVEALGAGLKLDPMTCTPLEISNGVQCILQTGTAADAAHRVQEEIAALPDVSSLLLALEKVSRLRSL
ncbi:MAG TPA: glycosyltransferase [Propionibacteriaceae bacterium]